MITGILVSLVLTFSTGEVRATLPMDEQTCEEARRELQKIKRRPARSACVMVPMGA